MWLKKQLLKWRVKQVTADEPVKLFAPDCEKTLALLGLLKAEQYKTYHPKHGTAVEVKLLHSNVEEFVENLRDIDYKLKARGYVTQESVRTERRPTNLENYFVTKDGFILDLHVGMLNFKHYATSVCDHLTMQREGGDEKRRHFEHNQRMLTHVLADIQVLSRALLSIAYQKGE
jgi:hypothetical protein